MALRLPKINARFPLPIEKETRTPIYTQELHRFWQQFMYQLELALQAASSDGGFVAGGPALQAPGGDVWQLGVDNGGNILVARLAVSSLVFPIKLVDAASAEWGIGVTNDGELISYAATTETLVQVILVAPNGSRWKLFPDTDGTLMTEKLS